MCSLNSLSMACSQDDIDSGICTSEEEEGSADGSSGRRLRSLKT